MLLTIDVGNSNIHAGVFKTNNPRDGLLNQLRMTTRDGLSSDELGLFAVSGLREGGFDPKLVDAIAICSVVPDHNHSIRGGCQKYFGVTPLFLQAGTKTGLRIRYRNPVEVGADRIAAAIGASSLFPDENLIIVDYGTATTFDVVTAERDYLGGLILPGLRISMEALELKTARLPSVEISAPEDIIGRSTVESIQSGLYYGNMHALRGISEEIRRRYFDGRPCRLVGTGGFSRLFEREHIFDSLVPELVLQGLQRFHAMNQED